MGISATVVNVFCDAEGNHGNPLGIIWASASTRRQEQQIASDLGFSETVFIDDVDAHEVRARIFTPTTELRFAGHPTVGLAAWLRSVGDDITSVIVPAGVARVRPDGDRVFVNAMVDWAPAFELEQLDSPADVDAVDPDAYAFGAHYVWAWSSPDRGRIRSRMFAPALGIREDEATGAAAIRLSAALGADLDIRQGTGSQIFTHRRYLGQQVEVGGRIARERTVAVH